MRIDSNFRSSCCQAPIRLYSRRSRGIIRSKWQCVKCKKIDVDFFKKNEQNSYSIFSEEDIDFDRS